jgi:hypothetical protein
MVSKSTLDEAGGAAANIFILRRQQQGGIPLMISQESERDLARKLIKQIPQKIKIVDT